MFSEIETQLNTLIQFSLKDIDVLRPFVNEISLMLLWFRYKYNKMMSKPMNNGHFVVMKL